MLNDFTWNMTGYIPKHQVNPHGDGLIPYVAERIFQLEPEPPTVSNPNEHILSALQEKNLLYFSFFLHHYEPQLNKRIKGFLGVEGMELDWLIKALEPFADGNVPDRMELSKADLYELGLSGRDDSEKRRKALAAALNLPTNLSANALLEAIRILISKEEFENALEKIQTGI